MANNKNKVNHPFKVDKDYFEQLNASIIDNYKANSSNEKNQTIESIDKKETIKSKSISFLKLNRATLKLAASISIITLLSSSIYYWVSRTEQNQDTVQLTNYTMERISEIAVDNNISPISENDASLYEDILSENTLEELQNYVDNFTEATVKDVDQQGSSLESYSFYDI